MSHPPLLALHVGHAHALSLLRETKVVNSWFQNKRAALRKRAEREVSEPVVTPRQSEPPATPQEDPLPPRSQHPSLPPISALLQRPAHHGSSGDESDVDEDDEMPVRLPPIQIAPGMRTAFGNAASEHDRLPDLYMGPEPSLSVSSSRHPQSVSYYAPRSVSAPYSAAPAAHALLSKRSFNEEDFPHRPSYPPPSSLHPSLRAAYPSPIPHPHLLPELTFSEPSRSYGSLGYSRGTSDGSRTPSSVYADDLVNRELPPLIQFGRTADDEVTSYRNRKLDDGHPIDPWAAPSLPPQHNGYKMRKRPSTHQLEELRRVYEATSHPSREERVRLAEETGLCVIPFISCHCRAVADKSYTGNRRASQTGSKTSAAWRSAAVAVPRTSLCRPTLPCQARASPMPAVSA